MSSLSIHDEALLVGINYHMCRLKHKAPETNLDAIASGIIVLLGNLDRQSANSSIDREWPVAYHGTTDPRAAEIVRSGGLDLKKGKRFAFRHGIYCTPDPKTALAYASPYQHDGKTYKLILQARVDPSRRKIVPKSKHGVADLDDYWIAKKNDAIRPYAICIFPC